MPAGDQIDAPAGQAGGFAAAFDAMKTGLAGQQALPGKAHFAIRLDAEYFAAQPQKELREHSGTRTDVGHHGAGGQTAFPHEQRHDAGRVAGPPADVVFNPRGEAARGVGVHVYNDSMNRQPHIVVVGSANTDLTTFTDQFPRAGETIFGRGFHLGFGGKGANQAVAARLCGAKVSMVARVGDDLFGPATIRNFTDRGVDASHVMITPGVSSGVAPIFVDSAGQNRIIVVKGANDLLLPADIDAAADLLRTADCIVLQLEIPLETVYYTIRVAREHGVRTILNPAPAQGIDFHEIVPADYVIPNETEAEALAGRPVHTIEDACACARSLVASGLRRVIITLGANGAVLATDKTAPRTILPHQVQPLDTTGAGDAFIGAFACFLSGGYDETEAVARANVYAALSTESVGTQKSFVTRERFEEAWSAAHRPQP